MEMYRVTATQNYHVTKTFDVEAENRNQAVDKAKIMMLDGLVDFDISDAYFGDSLIDQVVEKKRTKIVLTQRQLMEIAAQYIGGGSAGQYIEEQKKEFPDLDLDRKVTINITGGIKEVSYESV